MANSRTTQADKILAELKAAQGAEVPLYRLVSIASQYNARVKELRGRGHRILNRKKHMPDGSVHSWFRLEQAAPNA